MNIIIFDTHKFERDIFRTINEEYNHKIEFLKSRLDEKTVQLVNDHDAVCVFTNDRVNREVIKELSRKGVGIIALRCAGFNNVDLRAAKEFEIIVVRVPEYSPFAIAEHTMALILTLNRKTHKAYNRVREGNFRLDGLIGFDLHQKVVGVIGTGKIGQAFCNILLGFGCEVIAVDPIQNNNLSSRGVTYVEMEDLYKRSDIISLHLPLTKESHHLINSRSISKMKDGVFLINTSRGALVDTKALIDGLKSNKIGSAGLDVYEEEENFFFQDHSQEVIQDDLLARLITFSNVIITSHQGFFTKEALDSIVGTTLNSLSQFENSKSLDDVMVKYNE